MKPRWFRRLLGRDGEARLVAAIRSAEADNRGEVRVHFERRYPGDGPMARAEAMFRTLGMGETAADTGVLLYVCVDDRQAAVHAGSGVHAQAPPAFWRAAVDEVRTGFAQGDPIGGVETALLRIGTLLRYHLGGESARGNELPDAVTAS